MKTQMTAMEHMEDLSIRSAEFRAELDKHPNGKRIVRVVEIDPDATYFAEMVNSSSDNTVSNILWAAWKVTAGGIRSWNYDSDSSTLRIIGG